MGALHARVWALALHWPLGAHYGFGALGLLLHVRAGGLRTIGSQVPHPPLLCWARGEGGGVAMRLPGALLIVSKVLVDGFVM